MNGTALVSVVAALGMRHGVDPDHLSVIDGYPGFIHRDGMVYSSRSVTESL